MKRWRFKMKSSILLLGVLALIFLIGGVYAENQTCTERDGACCKGDVCMVADYMCTQGSTPYFDGCDENCNSIGGCRNLTCAKEGESDGSGFTAPTKQCCAGLTPLYQGLNEYENICGYHGADMGSICTNCGDGICKAGENKCNCAEDCKVIEVNTGFFTKIFNWFKNIFR